ISGKVDLKFGLCREHLEGSIDITQLSLDMLDALLAFLDPNKLDKNIQKNRELINAWYLRRFNPKIKMVSIWINYGNINLDIELVPLWKTASFMFKGLAAAANPLIQNLLTNIRIRRVNILPRLRAPLGKLLRKCKNVSNTKSARR
ncbi:unnamed protein product, partial [marine sediment metagenome]